MAGRDIRVEVGGGRWEFFFGTGANYNSRIGTAKRNQPTKDKGQETKKRTKTGIYCCLCLLARKGYKVAIV